MCGALSVVSSAALCPCVMEQRAICLSGQPSVHIPRSYQCVSPANEKLAGTLPQPLKWMTSLSQQRLPRSLASHLTLLLCPFSSASPSTSRQRSVLTVFLFDYFNAEFAARERILAAARASKVPVFVPLLNKFRYRFQKKKTKTLNWLLTVYPAL